MKKYKLIIWGALALVVIFYGQARLSSNNGKVSKQGLELVEDQQRGVSDNTESQNELTASESSLESQEPTSNHKNANNSGSNDTEALQFEDFAKSSDFTVFADRVLFATGEGAVNYDSKTSIADAFDQFVIREGLSSVLRLEYNECSTTHCIVSIEANTIADEQFNLVTEEALFGNLSEISTAGGRYSIVTEGEIKYLRVLYELGE